MQLLLIVGRIAPSGTCNCSAGWQSVTATAHCDCHVNPRWRSSSVISPTRTAASVADSEDDDEGDKDGVTEDEDDKEGQDGVTENEGDKEGQDGVADEDRQDNREGQDDVDDEGDREGQNGVTDEDGHDNKEGYGVV